MGLCCLCFTCVFVVLLQKSDLDWIFVCLWTSSLFTFTKVLHPLDPDNGLQWLHHRCVCQLIFCLGKPHQDIVWWGAGTKGALPLLYDSWLMHKGGNRRRDDVSAEHTNRSGPRVYYVGQPDYIQSKRWRWGKKDTGHREENQTAITTERKVSVCLLFSRGVEENYFYILYFVQAAETPARTH